MQMQILPVVNQILMLFLFMGIGLMLRKRKIFTDPVIKGVNTLVMQVTWPALMISTTQIDCTPETLQTFLLMLGSGTLLLGAFCVLTFLVLRGKGRDMAPAMTMLSVMPNVGFFGIPIVEALYGADGLLYLSAYMIAFNLILWTIGVSMFGGFSLKALKNLLNPGLVCAAVGIALFVLDWRLPSPVLGTADKLAAVNTPLSMLILGARMDTLRPRALLDKRIWLASGVKLVAMPLLLLPILKGFGLSGMALVILIAGAAMPSAASTQMLTERFGGDVYFTARTTSVSTVGSLLTLPLILLLAGYFA